MDRGIICCGSGIGVSIAANKVKGIASIKRGFFFADALEEYIKLKELLSPSTIAGYRKIQRNIPEWFMELKLKNITNTELQLVINEIAKTRSPKTTHNYFGLIGAVIRYYNDDLRIKITLPAKVKNEIYLPTDEEVKILFQEAINTRYYVPLLLAAYGLRRSEILALSMDDVKDDFILVTTKNNSVISFLTEKTNNPSINWITK